MEIAPDYNKDKVINEKDYGKATQEKPYRFWINNDHDTDDGDGKGEPLSGVEDSADNRINSKRDLEDFARLDIYLGGLHEAIASGQIKAGLKWKNTSGTSPSIKVWRNLSPNGGIEYLTGPDVAARHVSQLIDLGLVQGTGTCVIPQQFWQDAGLSAGKSKGHLLFEGVTEGKGQLTLVFQNAQGQAIGEGPGSWVGLKNIRRMYQRGKAQPENIAAPYFADTPFIGPMSYVDDPWNWPFEADPNEEKKAVIFVHGWSMDYANYLSFSETMFKRLWHQGFKGRFCAFRWDPLVVGEVFDISVTAGEYNRSEHRAWLYGESLRQFGNAVKGQGFTVSLIGHSMGNVVCSSSLKQGLIVQNYVLMEAAVPAGCYDASGDNGAGGVNGYARFWNDEATHPTPDYYQSPGGELAQGYRGFLASIGSNVAGDVVNFHNSDDYALATGHKLFGLKEANWEANEEGYKPDGTGFAVHDLGWAYAYDPSRVLAERGQLFRVGSATRFVDDSYEMQAFIARPRSKAVGAGEGTTANPLAGGPIVGNVNMRTTFGFGREDYDHSGQFNRRIQQVYDLYGRLFDIMK